MEPGVLNHAAVLASKSRNSLYYILHGIKLSKLAWYNLCFFRPCTKQFFLHIYIFYAILCVKFVREVRYFTSKVAIFSLSALVVREVTGDA